MAIRRPSLSAIHTNEWLCQDFLYQETPDGEERYLQVKWGGEPYTRESETFDYSNPPFPGPLMRGGEIVAQIDYSVVGDLVTITNWDANWRDEWPIRIGVNYLANCLYRAKKGYVIRVAGDEVYRQDGTPVEAPNKNAYAFWASEFFTPLTNEPYDYLLR